MKLTIGSRGSKLALIQSENVKKLLKKNHPDLQVEIQVISTQGDRVLERPIQDLSATGVFVKEVEEALLAGTIDLAVHSLKDMPSQVSKGLKLVAPPPSEDPFDALILKEPLMKLGDLSGVVGTGSPRRVMQLKKLVPSLVTQGIRGNIETRMAKIETEGLSGVCLAQAGLIRGGYENRIGYVFSPEEMIPAPCQGILGLEIRQDDSLVEDLCQPLGDEATWQRAKIERCFQRCMEAGCHTPLGVYAKIENERVHLFGCFGVEEKDLFVRREIIGPLAEGEILAMKLAEIIKEELRYEE